MALLGFVSISCLCVYFEKVTHARTHFGAQDNGMIRLQSCPGNAHGHAELITLRVSRGIALFVGQRVVNTSIAATPCRRARFHTHTHTAERLFLRRGIQRTSQHGALHQLGGQIVDLAFPVSEGLRRRRPTPLFALNAPTSMVFLPTRGQQTDNPGWQHRWRLYQLFASSSTRAVTSTPAQSPTRQARVFQASPST